MIGAPFFECQWGATTIRSIQTQGEERERENFLCLGFLIFFCDILSHEQTQRGVAFQWLANFFFGNVDDDNDCDNYNYMWVGIII